MVIGLVFLLFSICSSQSPFTTTTVGSSLARFNEFIDTLSTVNSQAQRVVHSSGGAAGGVISEGQGYGLFLGGQLVISLGSGNANYATVVDKTYQLFLGWKQMCVLSAQSSSCQSTYYCLGGTAPCLPHWKFDDGLNSAQGTGSATDGDEDAILGIILLLLGTRGQSYSWWNEVAEWAYQSCKQFYDFDTAPHPSLSQYRTIKLGSCWGGWDCNNPSYHAPAAYRVFSNFMNTFGSTLGHGSEGSQYVSKWTALVDSTYTILNQAQCSTTGLTPNWYVPNNNPALLGSTNCVGSGTPSAEYGAEASRGVWRIALDYLWFGSVDTSGRIAQYLNRVNAQLATKYSGSTFNNLDTGCLVSSIFSQWTQNAFIFGPTVTALVQPTSSLTNQQAIIDSAGNSIKTGVINSYYSGSWTAIATMTMNGDVYKARSLVQMIFSPTPPPVPTVPPPTAPPTNAPTNQPTSAGCTSLSVFSGGSWTNGFGGSYSWGTYNLQDNRMGLSGSVSVSLQLVSYGGLQLRCNGDCISTSVYSKVSFYVNTDASSSVSFRVRLRSGDQEVGQNIIVNAYPNEWRKVTLAISDLASGISQFNVLQIQDNSGSSSGSTIFLDNIQFENNNCGSSSTTPTNSPNPTNTPPAPTSAAPIQEIANNDPLYQLFRANQFGDGTYYGGNVQGGACSLNPLPNFAQQNTITLAALNQLQYVGGDHSRGCGLCLELNGTGTGSGGSPIRGPLIVYINDLCPECQPGSIDLGVVGDGRWGITWRAIDCPVGNDKLSYLYQGSNPYYIKLQVRGGKVPIRSLEFQLPSGEYVMGTRTGDNFFLADKYTPLPFVISSNSPLNLRITGVDGEVLLDSISELVQTNLVVVPGDKQVQFCGSSCIPHTVDGIINQVNQQFKDSLTSLATTRFAENSVTQGLGIVILSISDASLSPNNLNASTFTVFMSRTSSPNLLSDDDKNVVCEILDSLAFGLLGVEPDQITCNITSESKKRYTLLSANITVVPTSSGLSPPTDEGGVSTAGLVVGILIAIAFVILLIAAVVYVIFIKKDSDSAEKV